MRGLLDEIEFDPRWEKFPDVLKGCVQMIWGEGVLEAVPEDKDLSEQVMSLMMSKKYLDIIAGEINSRFGGDTGLAGLILTNESNEEGKYDDLTSVFGAPPLPRGPGLLPAQNIYGIEFDKIDRKLIGSIVAKLRLESLGIKQI